MDTRVQWLCSLADSIADEFSEGGERSHIDKAIELDREILKLTPPTHPMRTVSLALLSNHLGGRYERFGETTDIEDAIVMAREALVLRPPGHPYRAECLHNLAMQLSARQKQLGKLDDLDEAIQLDRDSLALRPLGHADYSGSLNNLATGLSTRHSQLGAIEDLNEAIGLHRDALAIRSPGHLQRWSSLNNLATDLSTRYSQLHTIEDLEEAISLHRAALPLCPPGHPKRWLTLDNLAAGLSVRYNHLGDMKDLDEAIVLNQDALVYCPPGHPEHSISLNNLANHFLARYRQLKVTEDLKKAILIGRDILMESPRGHPSRYWALHNLAVRLFAKYNDFRMIKDLDMSILLGREALMLCPPGHSDRSSVLDNYVRYLRARVTRLGQSSDQEELFGLYDQLTHISQMVSFTDLSTARIWTRMAEDLQHPTTLLAYETFLRLLHHHLTVLPSLPQHLEILKDLTSLLAVDTFSAYLRNRSYTRAVELLEQGRGVFWSQLNRLRSPVDDVMVSGPAGKKLGAKFTQLTSLIRKTMSSPGPNQHDRVCRFNIELQRVVEDIRRLPNLSHFLLPLLFSDLQTSASEGPVIIVNASTYSCDALIIFVDRDPVHVPLQITKDRVRDLSSAVHRLTIRAKSMDVTKEFIVILRDIWDAVVSLIAETLQTIYPLQSRIWWCPTAEFCLLPLHAAGAYRKGQKTFSDLYISSYTPTLTALIRARRQLLWDHTARKRRFIAIGQANGQGQSELPSVGAELANIGQRMDGLVTFTSIEGSESCISRVNEALGECEWVHFACHGLPNRQQPFASSFGLHDGRLTVQQIIQCELESAEFAYLSACHTTVGYEGSPDEMIHLASAMQFAGFRSVVGTMWAVDDRQAKKITPMFYGNMTDGSSCLDHTRAALALHKTMKGVVGVPFDQRILYVHLGA